MGCARAWGAPRGWLPRSGATQASSLVRSKKQQKAALFADQILPRTAALLGNGRADARRLIITEITRTDGESFEGGRVMIFPDGHSDPRTWHTPSPLETRRCVERRASLSHRARLSLANATSASRGTHGPTDCGGDQHGTRSTHPAAWTGGRVVISRTETSAEPARAASRPSSHPRSPSRVTRRSTEFTMADWWNSIQKGALDWLRRRPSSSPCARNSRRR